MASNDIRAGAAYVELGVKGDLQKQLDDAAKRLKSFGDQVTNIGKGIGALGASILTPLLGAATAFGITGKELEVASQKTGVAVESLSELKYAAETTGASFEDVTTGIRHMQRTLSEAANGSSEAVKALQSLHLTIQQLRGLTPDQQFKLIADRLGDVQSASVRTATAMAIFGRGGTSLLPMMRNLDELTAHARTLGIVMSTEDAQAAKAFEDTLTDLYAQLKAVTFQVGAAVAIGLQPFANAIRSTLPAVIQFAREHQGLIQAALAVGIGLTAVGGTLIVFGQSLRLVGSSWLAVSGLFRTGGALLRSAIVLPINLASAAFSTLLAVAGGVGAAITATIGGIGASIALILSPIGLIALGIGVAIAAALIFTNVGKVAFDAIGQAAGTVGSKISSAFSSAFAAVSSVFAELKSTALETFGGIANALSAGDIALAARILWVGLQLAWVEGTQGLRDKWSDFKSDFVQIAGAAFYGAQEVWATVKASIESSWSDFTSGLGNVWDAIVGTMIDAWNSIASAVSKTINEIHAAYAWATGGTFDADAADKSDDDSRAQAEADRRKKEMDQRAQRDKSNAGEQARIEAEKTAQIKSINDREAELSKSSDDKSNAEKAALVKQRADLQQQLDALKAKSGSEKQSTDDQKKKDADKQKQDDDQGDNVPQTKSDIKSSGLFNIAGLQGLNVGGTSQQDRIAKATEETAKNTAKIGPPTSAVGTAAAHKAYMDDLRKQNQGDSTYSKLGRIELSDAKNNGDGTYNVKSALTGITATLTKAQLDAMRQKMQLQPKTSGADIDAAARAAMQRRDIMTHQTPKGKDVKDENGAQLVKGQSDGNTYLKKIADAMPSLSYSA